MIVVISLGNIGVHDYPLNYGILGEQFLNYSLNIYGISTTEEAMWKPTS